jgi:hypothetical protein
MKNIVIAGDSYCASVGWPELLADKLGLNLSKHGFGGASWWITRLSLMDLPKETVDNTDVLVLCHTSAERIPVTDTEILQTDWQNIDPDNPKQLAVKLYWCELFSPEFSQFFHWARDLWIKEVSEKFKHCKIIHLHCFPWSLGSTDDVNGLTVTPNLTSISLNEINAKKEIDHVICDRPNHLNEHNNQALANEIERLIKNYHDGTAELDLSKFDLKTNKWDRWGLD